MILRCIALQDGRSRAPREGAARECRGGGGQTRGGRTRLSCRALGPEAGRSLVLECVSVGWRRRAPSSPRGGRRERRRMAAAAAALSGCACAWRTAPSNGEGAGLNRFQLRACISPVEQKTTSLQRQICYEVTW